MARNNKSVAKWINENVRGERWVKCWSSVQLFIYLHFNVFVIWSIIKSARSLANIISDKLRWLWGYFHFLFSREVQVSVIFFCLYQGTRFTHVDDADDAWGWRELFKTFRKFNIDSLSSHLIFNYYRSLQRFVAFVDLQIRSDEWEIFSRERKKKKNKKISRNQWGKCSHTELSRWKDFIFSGISQKANGGRLIYNFPSNWVG